MEINNSDWQRAYALFLRACARRESEIRFNGKRAKRSPADVGRELAEHNEFQRRIGNVFRADHINVVDNK